MHLVALKNLHSEEPMQVVLESGENESSVKALYVYVGERIVRKGQGPRYDDDDYYVEGMMLRRVIWQSQGGGDVDADSDGDSDCDSDGD